MCLLDCLGRQGEVLLPSFTFAATAQAAHWQGLALRFIDIDRETLMLTADQVERAITDRSCALFPVNLFGHCVEHDSFRQLAAKQRMPLIYDSAQAFGASYKGKMVGALGDAEVFSFHATKLLHTGEGGCVVTSDPDLHRELCKARNFGFDGYLNCTRRGINGKMSEFAALIGLRLLEPFPAHVARRKWVFQQYRDTLSQIPGIALPKCHAGVEPNYSYFPILVDPDDFGLSNLELNWALTAERIVTRCYFYPPVHRTTYYRKLLGNDQPSLPNTDWAALHVLCLPVYSDMRADEMAKVIEGVMRCHRHAGAIRRTVASRIPADWDSVAAMPISDPYEVCLRAGRQQGLRRRSEAA
jgi:dTDP-4-amino-4,6-dideoxygalactose transaminase